MTDPSTTLDVAHVAEDDDAPLHPVWHRYPRQTSVQPAYLELDCEAERLTADWDGEIGGARPMDVYHGHTRRYPIDPATTAGALNLLLDAVAPVAQRVVDGYASEWDGNNNVAHLDGDAAEAEDLIKRLCIESDEWVATSGGGGVVEAVDWLADAGNAQVAATTTDDELRALAAYW